MKLLQLIGISNPLLPTYLNIFHKYHKNLFPEFVLLYNRNNMYKYYIYYTLHIILYHTFML